MKIINTLANVFLFGAIVVFLILWITRKSERNADKAHIEKLLMERTNVFLAISNAFRPSTDTNYYKLD